MSDPFFQLSASGEKQIQQILQYAKRVSIDRRGTQSFRSQLIQFNTTMPNDVLIGQIGKGNCATIQVRVRGIEYGDFIQGMGVVVGPISHNVLGQSRLATHSLTQN
ncbi:MAG: hypothetical protein GY740_10510 [Gammaproteobacteria bacterium]|nr:hypothetical protein [Gammaproteobacteria bacterium]